jgi:hypothetical protein
MRLMLLAGYAASRIVQRHRIVFPQPLLLVGSPPLTLTKKKKKWALGEEKQTALPVVAY